MDFFEQMEARIPHGEVRTRFAPSPTGYMHVGNLRTALYTWLIARRHHGKFILRIEDTDQGRLVEGAVDVIYKTMAECGLDHDEGPDVGGPVGPYIQSERRELFGKYAKLLCEKGGAYYCFCQKSDEDESEAAPGEIKKHVCACRDLPLEEAKKRVEAGEPFVIRQRIPHEGTTTFHDASFGDITVENKELEDQVLLKSDGLPTYNFANVVDDHLMGITHVVRGSEYLSSAPKYNLLYEAFGWEIPTYVHCSPVMRDAQHKMSKRHGDPSYEDLIREGYLTEAVLNYVALLGWSPKGENAEREFYTLAELAEIFDISGISKSRADISIFIKPLIKSSAIDVNVRMLLGKSFKAFRCCDDTHKCDILASALLDEINCRYCRTACGKHRIAYYYLTLLNRIRKLTIIFMRLMCLLITV